jgi:hypothetical protein
MISIPIAVYNDTFKWQLSLFWRSHKKVYGEQSNKKAFAVIVERNTINEPEFKNFDWNIDITYEICKPFFEFEKDIKDPIFVPLNIQYGLKQIIHCFDDDEIIEVLDCDMFHIKPHPDVRPKDDEIYVSAIYENWHLKSLTSNKHVIEKYLKPNHGDYNGGFVPLVGKAKTFKKILDDWIDFHVKIVKDNPASNLESIRWWSGMYSFQVACANNNVNLIARDWCHVPPETSLSDSHYVCHYSCDRIFDKRKIHEINLNNFPKNKYYEFVKDWYINRNNDSSKFKLFM